MLQQSVGPALRSPQFAKRYQKARKGGVALMLHPHKI